MLKFDVFCVFNRVGKLKVLFLWFIYCEVVRIFVACRCVFKVCSREACEVRFRGD